MISTRKICDPLNNYGKVKVHLILEDSDELVKIKNACNNY